MVIKSEKREISDVGKLGKLLGKGDPVAGGYKLAYFMEGGARYEVGSTGPSKSFLVVCIYTMNMCVLLPIAPMVFWEGWLSSDCRVKIG